MTPPIRTDKKNLVNSASGDFKMKDDANKTTICSDDFHSAVEKRKLKFGIYLLAAFLGAATIYHFVAPEEAAAIPKPQCRLEVCI